MRISDWSSDVCSSDLDPGPNPPFPPRTRTPHPRERRRAGGGRVRALILSVAAALLAVSPAMAQDGTDEAALPAATDTKPAITPLAAQAMYNFTRCVVEFSRPDRKSTRLNSSH